GIRGRVGQGLTGREAWAVAAALATHTSGGRIVLSRDGRPSGAMLGHAVLSGLLGAGCDVDELGVAPTPTCGFAVRHLKAAGGIQITASHNPAEWNGLKLFGPDGAVLDPKQGQKLKALYESGKFHQAAWDRIGAVRECPTATDWHRERVQQLVDVAKIRGRRLRVVLDAHGGAGGPLGRDLLNALCCTATVLGGVADGGFAHPPEPLAQNLQTVLPRVAQAGAAVGLVLDPE